MQVKERFLKYISMDTTSDPSSETFPSTKSQLAFAAELEKEMKELGLTEVSLDAYGYVFGTIPSTIPNYQGKILDSFPIWTPPVLPREQTLHPGFWNIMTERILFSTRKKELLCGQRISPISVSMRDRI